MFVPTSDYQAFGIEFATILYLLWQENYFGFEFMIE